MSNKTLFEEYEQFIDEGFNFGVFNVHKHSGMTRTFVGFINIICTTLLLPWFLAHRKAHSLINRENPTVLTRIAWFLSTVIALAFDIAFVGMAIGSLYVCGHILGRRIDDWAGDVFTILGIILFFVFIYIAFVRMKEPFSKEIKGSYSELDKAIAQARRDIEEAKNAYESAFGPLDGDDERIDVDSMSGADFERFCADLLRINGFTDIYITPGSGDHGIDITAEKDTLKWGFQCKRWSDTKVDNTTIAQTYTGKAIYGCDIVAIITTSGFTRQAESEATQLGVKMWGRKKLMGLMEELEDRDSYYFSRTA